MDTGFGIAHAVASIKRLLSAIKTVGYLNFQ